MLNGSKYFEINVGKDVLNAFFRDGRLTNKKNKISVNVAKDTIWYFDNRQKRLWKKSKWYKSMRHFIK